MGGTLLTAVQSSAAVIAIAQQMYGAGAIGLSIALPFLFGSNIGTTITAVLASFGGTVPAKRAAFFHVLFNVVGSHIIYDRLIAIHALDRMACWSIKYFT